MLNRALKLSSNWRFFPPRTWRSKNYFCSPALSWNSCREYHQTFCWNESHRGYMYQTTSIRWTWYWEISKYDKTPTRWSHPKDWCRYPAVYISRKIKSQFKRKEHKPPIVNQQNVVWFVWCRLHESTVTYVNAWRSISIQQSVIMYRTTMKRILRPKEDFE